ncbi:protein RCC2 homolog isoform X2 [Nematostella vectensis]|uniref:protein RCC2 homolog isoform X2 n=1 Tax=Nematostella vectensis TaxID=45351 RepID=UPI0020772F57|nr:protein RCC2 homolog isoform X2 [Nematostella vectensis]
MPPKKKRDAESSSESECKKAKTENEIVDAERSESATEPSDNGTDDHVRSEKANAASAERSEVRPSTPCGTLLICGGTNWDLIGRKELPKSAKNYGGPNLWEPHLISTLSGIRVRHAASGPSACHSIIVCEDGRVMSFGRNDKGQLGHGTTERCDVPKVIDRLKMHTIVQASCGRGHTLILTDAGLVFGFGDNKLGQIGQGHQKPTSLPCPLQIMHPTDKKVTKVCCGAEFSMLLDENGDIFSFGSPEYGQLGHNTDGQYIVSSNKMGFQCEVLPRRLVVFVERNKDGFVNHIEGVKIKDVVCGNNHTMALDEQGRVFTWGFGGYGRLGHQQPKDEHVPRLLTFFNTKGNPSVIFAGSTYSMAVCMGQLYFWGQTKQSGEAAMYPKPVQDLSGWQVRSVGCSKSSIVIAADDSVVSWGPSPTYGELGYGLKKGGQKSSTNPKIVEPLEDIYVHSVTCGMGHTLFIAKDVTPEDKTMLGKKPVYTPVKG